MLIFLRVGIDKVSKTYFYTKKQKLSECMKPFSDEKVAKFVTTSKYIAKAYGCVCKKERNGGQGNGQ